MLRSTLEEEVLSGRSCISTVRFEKSWGRKPRFSPFRSDDARLSLYVSILTSTGLTIPTATPHITSGAQTHTDEQQKR